MCDIYTINGLEIPIPFMYNSHVTGFTVDGLWQRLAKLTQLCSIATVQHKLHTMFIIVLIIGSLGW